MKEDEGLIRGFCQATRSYWFKSGCLEESITEEFMIGNYHTEGGTTGEFSIVFSPLAGRIVAELKAYGDSWATLQDFKDLLEKMKDMDDEATVDSVYGALIECDIKDLTKTIKEN